MIDNALFVPLECLHSHHDTVTYVYKREGLNIVKQEVIMGETNANNAVILGGLSEGDRVFMSIPSGQEEKSIDLLPELDGKRKKKEEETVEPAPSRDRVVRPVSRPTK